ncbi:MAG TPA: pirin-like C-terminal cupin domain-containing protein, partial [Acidimicrobiales bacterium]|nr:pirin-like C-terminal cupin domain-containing protein [Acidimicrobiales bacterium]
GRGIVHCEMFPLVDRDGPNPLELFQIWLNLPAEDKLVDPHFSMLWDEDVPRRTTTDAQGRTAEVTVLAGRLDDVEAPLPPPHSWAARPDSDLAIWHVRVDPGATCTLPAARDADTVRVLYLYEGASLSIAGPETAGAQEIGASTGAVVAADRPVRLLAGAGGAEVLVLQGRPIGEPVARYGPFVMNTEAEIRQAFADYQTTEFGGWPWPTDDPVHGSDRGRFARHADGRLEQPTALARH